MMTDMLAYYRDRANEYENIYLKPERQKDLINAKQILQDIFRDKEVFEIACGTGYWTEALAQTADTIVATDANETVLQIARSKTYAPADTSFLVADVLDLDGMNEYESLFGGFIWSHILLQDLDAFIDNINGLVMEGGLVVLMDNKYVEGSNLPIFETDNAGNTYQVRTLQDGTSHKILKNFPTEDFIVWKLNGKARDIDIIQLEYYWILSYKTPSGNTDLYES